VINAIMLCQSDKKADGKIFNVCTGRKVRIKDLLQIIIKSFGKDPSYPVILGEPTPRDQFGVFGNYDLIHRTLGWSPEISLEDGIARMADWVKKYYVKNG
jgi:nucleoside-diphosphate-sugar epimerase